jgi:GT2 family glycosyltransferase
MTMQETRPIHTPDISVVVVSWRTRDLTLACLAAVEADAGRSKVKAETILVDNASGDGTADATRLMYPRAIVIEAKTNLGFAAGCNLGLARARGRHVLMLNPDAAVPRGMLAALVEFLDATPRAGAVGCRLVSPSGEEQFSCGRFLTPVNQFAETLGIARLVGRPALRRSYDDAELDAPAVAVDWVVGACLAVRRTALDEVGNLDERFFMYSEDEDLCYRLRASGWSIHLLPRLRVAHVGGASAMQAIERMRVSARESQTAFVRKHHGAAHAAVFRTLMRIASLKPGRTRDGIAWGR